MSRCVRQLVFYLVCHFAAMGHRLVIYEAWFLVAILFLSGQRTDFVPTGTKTRCLFFLRIGFGGCFFVSRWFFWAAIEANGRVIYRSAPISIQYSWTPHFWQNLFRRWASVFWMPAKRECPLKGGIGCGNGVVMRVKQGWVGPAVRLGNRY